MIVITGRNVIDEAISMIQKGVYDFITKPLDLGRVGLSLDRAIDRLRLKRENQILRQGQAEKTKLPGMVGTSPQVDEMTRQIRLIAPRDTSVLIEGKLLLRLEYAVRATNSRFNLVYPFYLNDGNEVSATLGG